MTQISKKEQQELPALAPMLDMVEAGMGFVPNSMLTMAHWPELLGAFGGLGATILQTGDIEPELKQLIALVSSRASGCNYCQAHTSHSAHRAGAAEAKIAAAFEFEQSPLFSDRERVALRFGWHAAMQPNATEPSDFAALKQFFSEREVVEIVAVVSLFGFLNRWNDTMATELEPQAVEFGNRALAESGWNRGKH
ncbi:MAG: carboxymuconolactone decarboxylase family protein [Porticoccaceae bacterium]|nr:carboxymuconolactone decarboxylase family protein [Porticoccaceae bacterium]